MNAMVDKVQPNTEQMGRKKYRRPDRHKPLTHAVSEQTNTERDDGQSM